MTTDWTPYVTSNWPRRAIYSVQLAHLWRGILLSLPRENRAPSTGYRLYIGLHLAARNTRYLSSSLGAATVRVSVAARRVEVIENQRDINCYKRLSFVRSSALQPRRIKCNRYEPIRAYFNEPLRNYGAASAVVAILFVSWSPCDPVEPAFRAHTSWY